MATLKQVEEQLLEDVKNPNKIPITKILLYLEVIRMVVEFIINKGIIKDGKINKINWWNISLIIEIVKFFREVVRKLTGGEEG
jgi:hypothetical protein